ncbi:hypothetical protein [Amycolatopsis nigrescens]|uniref:hypothetical protein n=1 Tax=Amycolatopsis nigrescens TaxID=381445 RepID=UPI00035FA924|nr:hypothetical protein [Amycolatopsis nigrescens]
MPFADKISPAPREVRLAGAFTALPGVTAVVLAVVLVVEELGRDVPSPVNVYAEAGVYLVLAAGTLACAVGLLMGKLWARSPAVVVSLLVIGVGWYSTGPSSRPSFGVPIILLGLVVLVLLFRRPSRAWALGMEDGETEEEAAERGGAAGRQARREREGK